MIKNKYSPPEKVEYIAGHGQAEQCHEQECNINYIVNKYRKTGAITHQNQYEGRYDEMTGEDYHSAMNIVAAARSMYEELPSNIRKMTGGDPGAFYDFVQNPANQDKLIELGLADRSDFPIQAPTTPIVDSTRVPAPEPSEQEPGTIKKTE